MEFCFYDITVKELSDTHWRYCQHLAVSNTRKNKTARRMQTTGYTVIKIKI